MASPTQRRADRNSQALEFGDVPRPGGRLYHALTPRRIRNGLDKAPRTLARIGQLEARLARTSSEVRLAQNLRYRVFYEELSAVADRKTTFLQRDADRFDRICDHVLVIDHDVSADQRNDRGRYPAVVGTYRMLPHERATATGGFYTAQEYALNGLLRTNPDLRFLELGRSCVLASHRNKRVLEVLWAGVWAYIRMRKLDAMFGCASFPGTHVEEHALALSYLHHHCAAPLEWRLAAHPGLHEPMDLMPAHSIDSRAALKALPPLVKGYLRLGARVGDGAVIDRQFGTIDVCMVLTTSGINPRYFGHFGRPGDPVAVT